MIDLHRQNAGSPYTKNNRITHLVSGKEKFAALEATLEEASHHIHMEYYIIRNDGIGKRIRDILAKKAGEGVIVRLLYDGMGFIRLPRSYAKPLLDKGGDVYKRQGLVLYHGSYRLHRTSRRCRCV